MNAPPATRKATSPRAIMMLCAAAILAVSFSTFAHKLDSEPQFMDESAYLSQSYFWNLASSNGRNTVRWLEYAAYDLPPLPKYLIGASLQLHGIPDPGSQWMREWYRNPGNGRWVNAENLRAARLPSVALGALGCVAIFSIGVSLRDWRVGVIAGVLLMINPLYRLSSRRAMADVQAEAILLITLAVALPLWKRCLSGRLGVGWLISGTVVVGLCAGLAVLAKLNGGLALMTVAAWSGLAIAQGLFVRIRGRTAAPELARGIRFAEMTAIAAIIALATFVALNPFVTARPSGRSPFPLLAPVPPNQTIFQRLATVIQHRVDVSRDGQRLFPHDALTTLGEKACALVVQGFGRFGPFGPAHADSTRRFDVAQDWGAWVWLPCVAIGFVWAIARGARQRSEGVPPTAWAIAVQFLVAMATVGLFVPLAWDRYFLPIQASCALLVAGAAVSLLDAIRSRAARA